jgi:hypothetical protein
MILILLGDSINVIKENTDTLLEVSRDNGPEINAEKAKYMIISHHPSLDKTRIQG